MWFKIKSYLFFLIKSTNQHGVHSPFIYNLASKCFYKKTNSAKIKRFEKARKKLISNSKIIEVTDFGKGSLVFKSNSRKVSEITKVAGISTKKAHLLLRICGYFNFESILEIGTSVGLGTSTMSIGSPKAKIITLEGCPNTAAIAEDLFIDFNLKNIETIIGDFRITLPKVLGNKQFDLIYFDGNHQKDATIKYFNLSLPCAHNNSVFIFDDINWSVKMQEAWEEIKKHPQVSVTVDLFFWGLVFFRKEQKKQHFVIRI